MRISDWSSDVCSSDLLQRVDRRGAARGRGEDGRVDALRAKHHVAHARRAGAGRIELVHPKSPLPGFREGPGVGWSPCSPPSSEERRVGKECVRTVRSRWSPYHYKQTTSKTHKT